MKKFLQMMKVFAVGCAVTFALFKLWFALKLPFYVVEKETSERTVLAPGMQTYLVILLLWTAGMFISYTVVRRMNKDETGKKSR